MAQVQTASGRAIGVLDIGRAPGVPMIFLHGVGSDKSVWAPQLEHFGRTWRAVAFDYPGYGESDPAPPARQDGFAAAILSAMDALAMERAHICGLSLGGVVAIAMHASAPERCASLILADSFAVHPDGQAIYDRSVAASRNGSMRDLAEARVDLLLAPGADPQVRSEVVETMSAIDPQAYRVGAEAVWLADQRDRAGLVDVPTLVLVGAEDRVTPPALSAELARLVPGARLEVIPGAGHLSNLEQSQAFDRLLDEFVTSLQDR